MIGVVMVTHGCLSTALLTTAELIMGKQEQIQAITFESGEAVTDLHLRIREAVQQVDNGQGVLVLVDILGGSPYNAAALLAVEQGNIEIVSGMNLPMLFSILPMRHLMLTNLTEIAMTEGCKGIGKFSINKV